MRAAEEDVAVEALVEAFDEMDAEGIYIGRSSELYWALRGLSGSERQASRVWRRALRTRRRRRCLVSGRVRLLRQVLAWVLFVVAVGAACCWVWFGGWVAWLVLTASWLLMVAVAVRDEPVERADPAPVSLGTTVMVLRAALGSTLTYLPADHRAEIERILAAPANGGPSTAKEEVAS